MGQRSKNRKQQRDTQRKRKQIITAGVAIVVVAVLFLIIAITLNQPTEAPIPSETVVRYEGIESGFTEAGFPRLGAEDSPVQVVEYSSFDCPSCAAFHDASTPALVERVRAGDISFTYVPLYGTGGIANGAGAARAAVCAGRQGAFWEMHDALFTWQGLYGNQAFTQARILSGVNALGLNQSEFTTCFSSPNTEGILNLAISAFNELSGARGTPTITVNGVIASSPSLEVVNADIDSARAFLGLDQNTDPEATETLESEVQSTETPVTDSEATETPETEAELTPEATAEQ
ncbi:hypothetical protein MASR2M15_09670 [Anaerolineales bacterium]